VYWHYRFSSVNQQVTRGDSRYIHHGTAVTADFEIPQEITQLKQRSLE
jgi:hypothetical protein